MTTALTRVSSSPAETEALGAALAAGLENGDLLALDGELGAGKTTLARGLAAGLGADPRLVRSPTFVLHQVYGGGRLPLHHLDCFRLGPRADLSGLDLDDLLSAGVVVVEWAGLADLGELVTARLLLEAPSSEQRSITLHAGAPHRLRRLLLPRLA